MILSDAPHLHEELERASWYHIPHEQDLVLVALSSTHATLHPEIYLQAISDHSDATRFAMSCGSTSAQFSHNQMNNLFIDDLMEITVDGVTATKSKGIRSMDLTKVWGLILKQPEEPWRSPPSFDNKMLTAHFLATSQQMIEY